MAYELYGYEYYDGEEWVRVEDKIFNTPEKAKQEGIGDGFEYVRAVRVSEVNDVTD